ncbi:hypothetical protein [Rubritalea profundi]|nr:hypothetical protein [Rubritalea profundi]
MQYALTLKHFTDIDETGSLDPWPVDDFACSDAAHHRVTDIHNQMEKRYGDELDSPQVTISTSQLVKK